MKIVASFDESDVSKAVVPALQTMAREATLELHLVTVLEPHAAVSVRDRPFSLDDRPTGSGVIIPGDQAFTSNVRSRVVASRGQAIAHLEDEAKSRLAEIAGELSNGDTHCHVLWSEKPAEAIVGLADEVGAEMIALATHGRSGLSRAIAGSVAEAVIRTAGRPVIVVRP